MVRKRKEMRQIREILRLRHQMNLSYEQIGRSLRISKRTVKQYVDRANKAQLSWPIKDELDDISDRATFELDDPYWCAVVHNLCDELTAWRERGA